MDENLTTTSEPVEDTVLADAVQGASLAANKQSRVVKAALPHLNKKLLGATGDIDAVMQTNKVLNNPAAVQDTVKELEEDGHPNSSSKVIALGLASALPLVLGAVFGGAEGAVDATEGAFKGAGAMTSLVGDMNEQQRQAELHPLEKQLLRQKLEKERGEGAGLPLDKKVLVDLKSGRPVIKQADGSYTLLDRKTRVNAANIVTSDVYGQSKVGERSQASLIQQQEKLGLLQNKEQRLGTQFREGMTEKQSAETRSVVKNINTDSVVKKANEMASAADNIIRLADMSLSNPIAASAIPTFMARASGEVGNLSEADKRPFGGSQALMARLGQAKEQWTRGTMTPENQKFVKDLANTFRQSADKNRQKRIDELANQYSGEDLTKEQIKAKFEGGAAAQPAAAQMSPRERLEFLRQKHGGKK